MPHGGPDWGTEGPISTIYTTQDLGELAARLKSIDAFDRRGNVIFIDDFQSGFNAEKVAFSGASQKAEWSSQQAFRDGFSGHLVAGPATDDHTTVGWRLAYPALSKMGYEIAFSFDWYVKQITLEFRLNHVDTTHYADVRWTKADMTWSCWGDDLAYHTLEPTQDLRAHVDTAHVVKLVVDFVKAKYVRLISDNVEYDLSKYVCHLYDWGLHPYMELDFDISTRTNNDAEAYLHYLIVTQNEP